MTTRDCRVSGSIRARKKRRANVPTSGLTVFVLGLICAPAILGQRGFRTEDLEAAMLERITSFIQWPDKARPNGEAFSIAVLGASPITPRLSYLYERRRAQGAAPTIRHVSTRAEIGKPHVLFISGEYASELEAILAMVRGLSTLTVGNTPGFAKRGVAVNLVHDNDRVRFEVNRKALEQAGLRASYQLLDLAKLVAGGEP